MYFRRIGDLMVNGHHNEAMIRLATSCFYGAWLQNDVDFS